jgi:hypothetical protein
MDTGQNLDDGKAPRVIGWRRLLFVVLLVLLPVLSYSGDGNPFIAVACLAVYLTAARLLKSWLISLTLLGILCGVLFPRPVWSGGIEEHAWDSIKTLLFWTAIGIIAGFLADAAKHRKREPLPEAGSQDEHRCPS